MVIADNGGGMDGPVAAEWSLLAGGKADLPTGMGAAVSFFNTGHVAALSALSYDGEIIVATLCHGMATLIRWGKPVTDAVHRELNLQDDYKRTLQNAAITFNMATRRLVEVSGLSKGASSKHAHCIAKQCADDDDAAMHFFHATQRSASTPC